MEYWLAFEVTASKSGGIDKIESDPDIGGNIKEGESDCM